MTVAGLSCKDGSPEMIGPPEPLDSEIVGPLLREPVPHANNAPLAKLNTKQAKKLALNVLPSVWHCSEDCMYCILWFINATCESKP